MDPLQPADPDSFFDMDPSFDDCAFTSYDGHSSTFLSNRAFGIDDPSKALQMELMDQRRDSLTSRRLSSGEHGGNGSNMNGFLTLDPMSGDRRDIAMDHSTEFIHSAPVLNHTDTLSNHHWSHPHSHHHSASMAEGVRSSARFLGGPSHSASTVKDDPSHQMGLPPPIGEDTMRLSRSEPSLPSNRGQNSHSHCSNVNSNGQHPLRHPHHAHPPSLSLHPSLPSVPMSAPIRDSSGSFQSLWNAPGSRPSPLRPAGQKRSFTELMDGPLSGGASAHPSPKRLKYITPGGTPTRDGHMATLWTSTPHSGQPAVNPSAADAASSQAGALPPDVSIHRPSYMDASMAVGRAPPPPHHAHTSGSYAPPPAPQFVNPGIPPYSVSGFGQQVWSQMQCGFAPPMGSYQDHSMYMHGSGNGNINSHTHTNMNNNSNNNLANHHGVANPNMLLSNAQSANHLANRRKRRRPSLGRSSLVPKVPRPSRAGAAEKWKNLSKKDREKARRAELKQCYQDLAVTLQMEAKRSGAQLPDRAEIVRAACAEIRRLERTLGSLQGGPDVSAIKDQVKSTLR